MAVKPITNKQVVNKQSINRGKQVSTKNSTIRGDNARKSYTPGTNYSQNYSITLKDIDKSIMNHIKNVMKANVTENGVTTTVPVLYANQERWADVRKNNILKDKSGAIMLPLILLKRTNVDKTEELPVGMEHDVQGKYAKVVRNSSWSKDNRYDRFEVQTGKKPVQELLYTGMPDFVVANYTIMMFTNYMEQMNVLNELFLEHLETYWGKSTSYKFLSGLDGSISNVSEMNQDGERLIKNEFGVSIKGYVIPEFTSNVFGTTAELQQGNTISKVVFGEEGDATDQEINIMIGGGDK